MSETPYKTYPFLVILERNSPPKSIINQCVSAHLQKKGLLEISEPPIKPMKSDFSGQRCRNLVDLQVLEKCYGSFQFFKKL